MKQLLLFLIFSFLTAAIPAAPLLDPLSKALESHLKGLKSYQCEMVLESGGKSQQQIYWFQKPGFYQVKQTGDFRNGFVISSVPGRPGQVLIFPNHWALPDQISLDAQGSLARSVTGDTLPGSDVESLFVLFKKLKAEGAISCHTVLLKTGKQFSCELLTPMLHPHFNLKGIDQFTFTLNRHNRLVRLIRWTQGKVIHQVQWHWVQLNQRLKPQFFLENRDES